MCGSRVTFDSLVMIATGHADRLSPSLLVALLFSSLSCWWRLSICLNTSEYPHNEWPLDFYSSNSLLPGLCRVICLSSLVLWHEDGCWILSSMLGGSSFIFLDTTHNTDAPATRDVVSILRQEHAPRLGHPLRGGHLLAPRFYSSQTRCRAASTCVQSSCRNADASLVPHTDFTSVQRCVAP